MSLRPGTLLGAYEIIALIGAGGMGEVYKARDSRLGRMVAVKVLPADVVTDPAAKQRFEREARAVAALAHPSIVSIFEFGSSDGVSYAVTELLEGETLRARLAEGPLTVRKAVELGIQIAEGLGAAHAQGIVHRDLKPGNLFLTNSGRIKILDFGLARAAGRTDVEETSSTVAHTEPGIVLGTVGYMSPEQVRGLPADLRSDIFACGCVLYEMVSGHRAFKRESAVETMSAILTEDPPDLSGVVRGVPPAFERIVHHCLEKRPEQRFQSAHDMAFDLQALSTPSGMASGDVPRRGFTIRRALISVVMLALGLALGVFADRNLGHGQPAGSPTYRRLTYDRGILDEARFAPDGNTVVYSAAWRGEPTEIYTLRLDSPESRSLGLVGAILNAVSSTSELAVCVNADNPPLGEGRLSRVPLAGGAPRELVDNIRWADWSPDGTELAIVRVLRNSQRVEFPIGRLLYESRGNLTHLRVSPRGDWLVVADHPADTSLSGGVLVAIDRNGASRVLSKGWGDLWGVAWHPDGKEVWFTASKLGEPKALYAVTLDGKERLITRMLGQIDLHDIASDGRVLLARIDFSSHLTVLPPGAAKERDLTWLGGSVLADLSGDGARVLFNELPEGGVEESTYTYLRDTNGAPAIRLGRGRALALSPDGKWAICSLTAPTRLVLVPTGVGEPKRLPAPPLATVTSATWFPDSRRFLFIGSAAGDTRAYLQNIESGEFRAIGPAGLEWPTVSPDGRSIAATASKRTVLVSVDRGESKSCPGAIEGDRPIRWSADGHTVFVSHSRGLASEIFSLAIPTGRRTFVKAVFPTDVSGLSGPPDALSLTADGKSYAYSSWRQLSDLYLVEGLK